MVDVDDIEEIILTQVAAKIIDTIPEKEMKKILEVSLATTLKDILSPWNVKDAIEADVNKYMLEYIKRSEVQEKIKLAAENNVDKLMDGVIETIIVSAQDSIKSKYVKFVAKKEI